jgi:hypothetical protein
MEEVTAPPAEPPKKPTVFGALTDVAIRDYWKDEAGVST